MLDRDEFDLLSDKKLGDKACYFQASPHDKGKSVKNDRSAYSFVSAKSRRKNMFYDEKDINNLNKVAKYFIGGIIRYARETSIIMASTLNSYKACMLESEAYIARGWGFRNRNSMLRVPYSDVRKV